MVAVTRLVHQHQPAALLADAHGSVLARHALVLGQLPVGHGGPAVRVPAGDWAVGAVLDVGDQVRQAHHRLAPALAVLAAHLQVQDDLAQRQHVLQVARGERLAALGAGAVADHPGQDAPGAVQVAAGGADGVVQHPAAHPALLVFRDPAHELVGVETHGR